MSDERISDLHWGALSYRSTEEALPPLAVHLAETLQTRPRRALDAPRRAAILVALLDRGEGPELLLTRRAVTLNHHGGEVAFPGGMREPEEQRASETALREAQEEIGLEPSSVEILGLLDDLRPQRPGTIVTPVVAWIHGSPTLRRQPEEVDRIFSLPFSGLQQASRWETREIEWRGNRWPIYHFEGAGERLWGMSAYATLILLEQCPGGSPIDIGWLLKPQTHQRFGSGLSETPEVPKGEERS